MACSRFSKRNDAPNICDYCGEPKSAHNNISCDAGRTADLRPDTDNNKSENQFENQSQTRVN